MYCYIEFWLSDDSLLMIPDGYDNFCAGKEHIVKYKPWTRIMFHLKEL